MANTADPRTRYQSPLTGRYASQEMQELFSDRKKIQTWRSLWICLAEVEKDLGLPITDEQVEELKAAKDNIDFELAASIEKETRHDVMAHIRAYASLCPNAGSIIHLGATSCYVGDNTELIIMLEACKLVQKRLLNLIDSLSRFAISNKDMATLAYTHFQPAQLTTIGKRACLWLQDLVMDYEDLNHFISTLGFRGVKGTTGTQASFLKLFDGDHDRVADLDRLVTNKMGFGRSYPITGQTYPRKVDAKLMSVLAGLATSAAKFAADVRLLAHERELEEPFLETQVGSSAMAYKRNPMRCERISSLTRFVISLVGHPYHLAGNQWLERTLDDSAGRRIVIPESFLAIDAILNLYHSVVDGFKINPNVVKRNMMVEISFMATENILMAAVQAGGNRQELHEKIRQHSFEASKKMKEDGAECDLMDRLRSDPDFAPIMKDMDRFLDPAQFTGRAAEQVEHFIRDIVYPLLVNGQELIEDYQDSVNC